MTADKLTPEEIAHGQKVAERIDSECNAQDPRTGLRCNLPKHDDARHQFKGAVVWWSEPAAQRRCPTCGGGGDGDHACVCEPGTSPAPVAKGWPGKCNAKEPGLGYRCAHEPGHLNDGIPHATISGRQWQEPTPAPAEEPKPPCAECGGSGLVKVDWGAHYSEKPCPACTSRRPEGAAGAR